MSNDNLECPKCNSCMVDGPYNYSEFPATPDWRIYCEGCNSVSYGFSEDEVLKNWVKEKYDRN